MKKVAFDKDMLIKHRFWIGLGLTVPLSLVAILILTAFLPGEIRRQRKNIEDDISTTNKVKGGLKNEGHIDLVDKVAQAQEAQKDVVWAQAWREQDRLYMWPKEIEEKYGFNDGLFAIDIKVTNNDPAG